ncbi:hypothetical protein [uncultured Mucilaginibacter sp.]|uniref:hypothetical protein n=1 Tax=uncultured Mucilaginibacter sp. TaxID=797541 RepID=UPI00261BBA82|nr:hypothetical protein [uncultured Mucilaginibacter sp.]
MKDELIDRMNKETDHQRFIMAVSAFAFAGLIFLAALLILNSKHPHLINLTQVTLIKSFFRNFG